MKVLCGELIYGTSAAPITASIISPSLMSTTPIFPFKGPNIGQYMNGVDATDFGNFSAGKPPS